MTLDRYTTEAATTSLAAVTELMMVLRDRAATVRGGESLRVYKQQNGWGSWIEMEEREERKEVQRPAR